MKEYLVRDIVCHILWLQYRMRCATYGGAMNVTLGYRK